MLSYLSLLVILAAAPVLSSDLELAVYGGLYDVGEARETGEVGVELRRPVGSDRFEWSAGLATTSDEAAWVYGGAGYDWRPGARWRLRPAFAISLFDDGDGKDLGGPVEFRSSLELAYTLRARLRLGLLFYHLSNAGIYDRNPGSNSAVLIVSFEPW